MYVDSIVEDVGRLGAKPEKITYTSDYFDQMLDLAERLIKAGHLYADDTPQEKMKEVRNPPHACYASRFSLQVQCFSGVVPEHRWRQ